MLFENRFSHTLNLIVQQNFFMEKKISIIQLWLEYTIYTKLLRRSSSRKNFEDAVRKSMIVPYDKDGFRTLMSPVVYVRLGLDVSLSVLITEISRKFNVGHLYSDNRPTQGNSAKSVKL